ncbi:HAD domain-containing protein [Roseateles albus]|uniref:HAD domain-containing protein n=1 Tax=Roseateles albus TaxID=2987525 RepID=A0ABT5KCY4_9BURK|nr:HAD domain-containing protein [Roseateles albus]MDC8771783.1 HAD domain-containing protein [Roseateles albus]
MSTPRPLLFLDVDGVLCLSKPYGGHALKTQPPGIWDLLFARHAVEALNLVMREHAPQVVITSSWLSFLEHGAFDKVFRKTGLSLVADGLHPAWEAPQNANETRCAAIDRWFQEYGWPGEPYVILDDMESGTGLKRSYHDYRGRVVFCDEGVGLSVENWLQISLCLDTVPAPRDGFSRGPKP